MYIFIKAVITKRLKRLYIILTKYLKHMKTVVDMLQKKILKLQTFKESIYEQEGHWPKVTQLRTA